ncbi:MAG: tetratricopeptide repeat protein, partial [Caldilineaceae bacterium]|nr:tetratricopeptide repeat protein [Caldilineaceae bacterium]
LQLFQAVGARLGEANVLLTLGDLLRRGEKYEAAWQHYERVLHLYSTIGDRYSIARVLYRMGDWKVEADLDDEAIPLYNQSITLWRGIGLADLASQIIEPRLNRLQK